jgi:plastocyanin
VLLVGIGVAACGDDGGTAASPATPATSGATASTAATGSSAATGITAASSGSTGTGGSVSVINQVKFLNAELKVAAGTSVEFDNKDSQAHTATSDDGTFDTGLIAAGANTSVKFDKAGTFSYHCSLHPFMKAKVVVT